MKYIKGYDAFRAVAVCMVFYSHTSSFDFIADSVERIRIEMICSGGTGVRIYFSLSGFLITLLLMKEKLLTGKILIKNFYIRRFLKLTPPLILYYSVLILLMSFGFLQQQWVGVSISFFYLFNFVPRVFYTSELGPTWTLGVEEQFYVLWPLIVSFFTNKIVRISISIIAICWFADLYIPRFVFHYKNSYHTLNSYFFIERWFFPACAPIITGAVFSYLLVTNKEKWRLFFFKKSWPFIAGCLLFFLPIFIPKSFLSLVFLLKIIQAIGISTLLVWIFFNQNNSLIRLLEFKPLSYIGKISYGLYVYHGIFIGTGPGLLFIQQYPLNVFLTVGVAILSYEFYEKPILKLKDKFTLLKKTSVT